jgi:hypothetical protein
MKYEESRQKRILPANHKDQVYIHVFGAGYILDKRLNPSQQLSPTSLTRLVEAVRLMKSYPNAVLVTSGHSRYGNIHSRSLRHRVNGTIGNSSAGTRPHQRKVRN